MKKGILQKAVAVVCVLTMLLTVIATGTVFATAHGDAFAKKISEAKTVLGLKDFLTTDSYNALNGVYETYKDVNPETIDEGTANTAISALDTAIGGVVPSNPVLLTGQSYSASYKTWITGADSSAPVNPASKKAEVLDSLCSGCALNTPYSRSIDGDKGNGFHMEGTWQGGPNVFVYDLGGKQFINRVDICNCPDSAGAKSIASVKIEVSNDLSSWTEVSSVNPPAFDAWQAAWNAQLITLKFNICNARYVKVTATRANYCLRISEIGISGIESPAAKVTALLEEAKTTLDTTKGYEAYYTPEKLTKLQNDYDTISKVDVESLSIEKIAEYVGALESDISAIKDDVNGSVILSGNQLDAASIEWIRASEPETPNVCATSSVITTVLNMDGPGNSFDGSVNGNPSWGNWDKNPVLTVDMGDEQIVGRVDFVENCHDALANYQVSSITVEKSLDNVNWEKVAVLNNPPAITEKNSKDLATIKFPYTKARYIRVTPARAGHAVNCRELVVYGHENPLVPVKSAIKNAEAYTNRTPYEDDLWEAMQSALSDAKGAVESGETDVSKLMGYIDALNKAVDGLRLRGGDKLISQNNIWESDWQGTGYADKGILQVILPNAKASYDPETDAYAQTQSVGRLFSGGMTNGAGDSVIFTDWGKGGTIIVDYDLGQECWVDGVDLATRLSNTQKTARYTVFVSNDGVNYTEIGFKSVRQQPIEGEDITAPNGVTVFTDYTFPAQKARYVKIKSEKGSTYQQVMNEVFIRGSIPDENNVNVTRTEDGLHIEFAYDGDAESVQLISAVYDKDGKFQGVQLADKKEADNGKAFVCTDVTVGENQSANIFAFDSTENIIPLGEYKTEKRYSDAEFKVADIFSNDGVLQRGVNLPVFGKAPTGTEITVTLDGKSYTATADEFGDWTAYTDPIDVSKNPYTLTVTDGEKTITYTGLLAGEVWLASGQSNMWWKLSSCDNASANIQSANNYPNMRFYQVPIVAKEEPCQDIDGGKWEKVSSANAGNLSAVAFLTARNLSDTLNVPIGVIEAARGGTSIEGFISRAAFKGSNVERYYSKLDRSLYYNGMINPVIPYAIKGCIWYQGCQNHAPNAAVYLDEEILLLKDWRSRWGYDFPFILSELAPCSGYGGFPEIRQRQLELRDVADKVGVISIMDAIPPSPEVIHPTNKQPVADRMALCAEAIAYGMDVQYLFPAPESFEINFDRSVTVTYKDVYDGLKIKSGSAPCGFELAGPDGIRYRATAEITGPNTIRVHAPEVTDPVTIYYGYKDYPDEVLNLYNSADLVATPFKATIPQD